MYSPYFTSAVRLLTWVFSVHHAVEIAQIHAGKVLIRVKTGRAQPQNRAHLRPKWTFSYNAEYEYDSRHIRQYRMRSLFLCVCGILGSTRRLFPWPVSLRVNASKQALLFQRFRPTLNLRCFYMYMYSI